MHVDVDGSGEGEGAGVVDIGGAPAAVPNAWLEGECHGCFVSWEKRITGEGDRYQKFEGEYLFATRTRASLVSEDMGKTEKVEEGWWS